MFEPCNLAKEAAIHESDPIDKSQKPTRFSAHERAFPHMNVRFPSWHANEILVAPRDMMQRIAKIAKKRFPNKTQYSTSRPRRSGTTTDNRSGD